MVNSFWSDGSGKTAGGWWMQRPPPGVSERTAYSWLARYRAGGERALRDRSSAPARSPHRLPGAAVAAIERLRRQHWTGPRIARALGRPVSTVGTVLRRLGLGRLAALDAKPPILCERWLGAGLSEATASEGAGDRHALQLRFTEVLTKIYLT